MASGWSSEPPSYSSEYKLPNESYPPYPIQYATPYAGQQQQNVVVVQPHVINQSCSFACNVLATPLCSGCR